MSTTPVPYTPPYQKIADRKVNVAMKLGNRQDLLQPAPDSVFTYSRISGWLRDAYIAIATCRTFEQSEKTFQFQTVAGQDTYPLPSDLRAMKAFTGYDQFNTPIQVLYKSIAYIRRYNPGTLPVGSPTPMLARPSIFTFFGNNIIFRPVPDQSTYTFFLDYWQRPLISQNVDSSYLLVPDEWLEVVDYEAAIRGNAELQQADRSREMMEMIYGFSDPTTGRSTPGIIERLQNRAEAMSPYTDWGIQPQWTSGYTK